MNYFIFIFQIIALIMLLFTVLNFKIKNNLKINIYNIPIIIFSIVFLLLCIFVSLYRFISYIPFGIFLGVLFFIINSFEFEGMQPANIKSRIIFSLFVSLAWPQILVFVLFLVLNLNDINFTDEKS